MTNRELLDLYSDYLISSFGQTTGTGLSALLGGSVNHDRIQRFLAQPELTSADFWRASFDIIREDIARFEDLTA